MNNDNVFFSRDLVNQAQRERDTVLAAIGNKLIHAPTRIIRLGISDFLSYRRPANTQIKISGDKTIA